MARQDEDKADTIPDEATVAAYLADNPDFLVRHPELVQLLDAPSRFAAQADGANVVDMQTFMVGRLQADLARARRDQVELIQSARSNLTSQGQIHEAVLAALDARDFEHFVNLFGFEPWEVHPDRRGAAHPAAPRGPGRRAPVRSRRQPGPLRRAGPPLAWPHRAARADDAGQPGARPLPSRPGHGTARLPGRNT